MFHVKHRKENSTMTRENALKWAKEDISKYDY